MRESNKKICRLGDLYNANLCMPYKYYALGERVEQTKEQIIKVIPYKNRKKVGKLLDSICKDYEERNSIENQTQFSYAYSLAVQIMSECFSMKIQ